MGGPGLTKASCFFGLYIETPTAEAKSAYILEELALLQDITKQSHYGDWRNYILGNTNCISSCDIATKALMTTVYDPASEDPACFNQIYDLTRAGAHRRKIICKLCLRN
jgi:hypothetical protein